MSPRRSRGGGYPRPPEEPRQVPPPRLEGGSSSSQKKKRGSAPPLLLLQEAAEEVAAPPPSPPRRRSQLDSLPEQKLLDFLSQNPKMSAHQVTPEILSSFTREGDHSTKMLLRSRLPSAATTMHGGGERAHDSDSGDPDDVVSNAESIDDRGEEGRSSPVLLVAGLPGRALLRWNRRASQPAIEVAVMEACVERLAASLAAVDELPGESSGAAAHRGCASDRYFLVQRPAEHGPEVLPEPGARY